MANHTGSEGVVKVGANTVAEVRSFSIEISGETIEDTSMGDTTRSFKGGLISWSGSIDCLHDETDTNGQMALDPGSGVVLNLYPEGAASSDTYFTGSALVTGRSVSASFDGMVEASYSFQGNGALTETTV